MRETQISPQTEGTRNLSQGTICKKIEGIEIHAMSRRHLKFRKGGGGELEYAILPICGNGYHILRAS